MEVGADVQLTTLLSLVVGAVGVEEAGLDVHVVALGLLGLLYDVIDEALLVALAILDVVEVHADVLGAGLSHNSTPSQGTPEVP